MRRLPRLSHPAGHFYSPVCDPQQLLTDAARIWPEHPSPMGIDFREEAQLQILREVFPRWIGDYDYPETLLEDPVRGPAGFYTRNSQFSWLDSRALFVLLREFRPKRIIEIGSGYSSLLMADVNRRFLDSEIAITCIEPFPRPFLSRGIPGIQRLLKQRVQEVPQKVFEELEPGDLLFIDSSHVSKTGSDVNHIYFEIVPRLPPGTLIHIHDIFLPADYCKDWAIEENRSWNEQYLVQAMLTYSRALQVVFGCNYAVLRFPEEVRRALNHPRQHVFGGASLWLQRNDERV
jgi:predicted O-methyltransferase YrrM